MSSLHHLKIEDLQRLCDEREEESLTLEFKSCSELKVGSMFWDKSGQQRDRERDDVLNELTKDVTAFLNSAGGTIIYGIKEKKSRANKVDKTNPFKLGSKKDSIQSEKIVDWLRSHIQPPPTVDVYRVLETDDPHSPWYLVIEIPQGQLAYMARDHKFYKRIGNTAQPMEQYEVADTMNRTRAAALRAKVIIEKIPYVNEERSRLRFEVLLTSTNFIAAEYGQIQITLAQPISLESSFNFMNSGDIDFDSSVGLILDGEEHKPHAQLLTLRWGAHDGRIVFPDAKFKVYQGGDLFVQVPTLSLIPNPTYLFQIELFTMNSQSKKALFSIQRQSSGDSFDLIAVDASNRAGIIASFWETYHSARETLKE